MSYYVYVILCENGAYYTGYTKNVESRVKQHKQGRGAKYLKMHKAKKVVYVEKFDTRSEAIKRELEIKRLSHKAKLKLASSWTPSS